MTPDVIHTETLELVNSQGISQANKSADLSDSVKPNTKEHDLSDNLFEDSLYVWRLLLYKKE